MTAADELAPAQRPQTVDDVVENVLNPCQLAECAALATEHGPDQAGPHGHKVRRLPHSIASIALIKAEHPLREETARPRGVDSNRFVISIPF